MSWHQLTHSELQACRKRLNLDVSEAAEFIGKVQTRTWNNWESGKTDIPEDIDMEIYANIQIFGKELDRMSEEFIKCESNDTVYKIPYYHSFEQYQQDFPNNNKLMWRIWQAAASQVFAEGGDVELC